MVHIADNEQSQDLNAELLTTSLIELYIIDQKLYIVGL